MGAATLQIDEQHLDRAAVSITTGHTRSPIIDSDRTHTQSTHQLLTAGSG